MSKWLKSEIKEFDFDMLFDTWKEIFQTYPKRILKNINEIERLKKEIEKNTDINLEQNESVKADLDNIYNSYWIEDINKTVSRLKMELERIKEDEMA